MKTIQQQQRERLCSSLVRDFIGSDVIPEQICIEKFITEYLGYAITYASLTKSDKLAFTSDGKTPILISVNGKTVRKVYPESTIVVDTFLKDDRNSTRRRFVLAHEAGHIIDAAVEGKIASGYYSDSTDGHKECTLEEIKQILTFDEANANQYGAAILMPDFVVGELIRKYHDGYKFNVYDEVQLVPKDRKAFMKIASILNVSWTALFYRIKALDGFVFQTEGEYIRKLNFGGRKDE